MLDEIVLDLAPLEGRFRSLGAEVRQLLRATPPAGDEEPLDSQALLLEEVLALAYDSPILYIHCAYGNERFKMRHSLRAGRFGRRSEEFAAKNHVEVEWQLTATDLDLAESWLKKRSPTSIGHSSYKAGG